nr:HAMP domain-containing sensor histidine kinase [Candidatus Sigynarchaeota archaeon]
DMSRLETGKLKIEQSENDLVDLILKTIEELAYRITQRDLTMKTSLPDKLVFNFDAIRIEQVITNLITNAIKNTPSGGEISVIVKRVENDSGCYVEVIVKDTGIGITKDEMGKLFTKFGKLSRDDHDVDIQGTGLGLFISKEIITIHGGKIWFESGGRNKGSTFHFTLPCVIKQR